MTGGQIVALIVAGLLALALALFLLFAGFIGAVIIFGFAGLQGFVGIAAYVAAWVFLFPIMATISIIVGIATIFIGGADDRQKRFDAREERRMAKWRQKNLGEDPPGGKANKWENRLPRFVVGPVMMLKNKADKRRIAEGQPPTDPIERKKWANRLPPYDDDD